MQRATAGAWVLEPNERGCATIVRTTDGESHETVRSALWHRGATVRARALAVIPCGLSPLLGAGADRSRSRCPSAVTALAAKRAPAVNAEAEAKR